jgi:hypothetical protein
MTDEHTLDTTLQPPPLDTSEPDVIPPSNAGPKDGDVPVEQIDQAPFDLGKKVADQ